MQNIGIIAQLNAKPGKENDLENFLINALPLANDEPGTLAWYALKLSASRFAIVDTFSDELGRDAHLSGKIASALMASAEELLSEPPLIEKVDILAVKAAR